MSEQTSQNKEYGNKKSNSAKIGIIISQEVTGIILIWIDKYGSKHTVIQTNVQVNIKGMYNQIRTDGL